MRAFIHARAEEAAEAGNGSTDDDITGLKLAEAFRRVNFRT